MFRKQRERIEITTPWNYFGEISPQSVAHLPREEELAMDIGLLWFDNDKGRDLAAKVQRAAEHYQQKFGRWPELCFVHPSQLPSEGDELQAGRVAVKASQTVLPHHFWLGLAE